MSKILPIRKAVCLVQILLFSFSKAFQAVQVIPFSCTYNTYVIRMKIWARIFKPHRRWWCWRWSTSKWGSRCCHDDVCDWHAAALLRWAPPLPGLQQWQTSRRGKPQSRNTIGRCCQQTENIIGRPIKAHRIFIWIVGYKLMYFYLYHYLFYW